jgi:D-sedoheptulose 7-phosphate isomerase
MELKLKIKSIIEKSIEAKQEILKEDYLVSIIKISEIITNAFKSGKKVLFCGNGGSAADAQHLAAEFSGRFYKDRKALPSDALHCNTSYLTAVANDYSYEDIYSRIIEGTGVKGDVLIGISTSGNSKNILKAFQVSKSLGVTTIGLTGIGGGLMKNVSDYIIQVPSNDTPRIQECHIMIGHILCEIVENNLF